MANGRILLQHGRAQRSFRVTGETDKAIAITYKNVETWIPRKGLRMDKQKIVYDNAYYNPYHVLKWFYTKEPKILTLFD